MPSESDSYWLVRIWIIRFLGILFLVAFLILFNQGIPLLGGHGLLPIRDFSRAIALQVGSNWKGFLENPSLFQFFYSDRVLHIVSMVGIIFSIPLILGFANFPILFSLWFLHLSVVNSGQLFYSFGWETQLLEFTFLCFFLCPLWRLSLLDARSPPKKAAIIFQRWMLFRLMLGAGLIKLRGDPCWRDLTCLFFHYETQPNPHPISWFYHQMPLWFHKGGALFNHFVEVVLPFGVFGPKTLRRTSGVFMALFQCILISSGNLAWLNWLTLIMTIPCLDDEFIRYCTGGWLQPKNPYLFSSAPPMSRATTVTLTLFTIAGLVLSVQPAVNLFSSEQVMNGSFNRFHFINSYGAFGSVTKERDEIVILGSNASDSNLPSAWKEYEFKCKPGRVDRRPCFITPYHYRLDWQIWFSAMRPEISEPWLARFAKHLLENDPGALSLLEKNPFPSKPPKWLRMDLYRYEFTKFGEPGWWKRKYLHPYLPPVQLSTLSTLD